MAFVTGKYTKTGKEAVGEWFEVEFKKNNYFVSSVRVQSYKLGDQWGKNRLGEINVFVDGHLCGKIPDGTRGDGTWYTVKCSQPINGYKVRLVTTRNQFISLSAIEVYGIKGGKK